MPITSTIQQGTLSLAAVTPGNSAIGDAAAAGTSASVARADHKHGREASGSPGASAVGDTASTGSATTVALSDHRHSREAFGTPVNIDASLTSLSTGSLTTVARADHVHTVSKTLVLLASTTLTTAQSSVSFSSIPQTFKHLQLSLHSRTASTGGPNEEVMIRCNSDASSSYYYATTNITYLYAVTNTASAYPTTGNLHYATSTGLLWNYANALGAYSKSWSGYGIAVTSTTGWSEAGAYPHGIWNNTSAVTSITISTYTGNNFIVGSSFQLYGVP